MLKNIFFDRDGIINEVVMRQSIVASPRNVHEFRIRDDFRAVYSSLNDRGLNLFVISNQPDISRGVMSEADLELITSEIEKEFSFREIVYCKHDNQDACECRKPEPGMIIYLLKKYSLQAADSIVVGDSPKDILAGQGAGIRTVLLSTRYNRESSILGDFCVQRLIDILSLPL